MDAQRFDNLAKAMASGSTRRAALRLAGGGLAGALLAAAGLDRRAGAQEEETAPCDELLPRCLDEADEGCVYTSGSVDATCLRETGGRACHTYLQACSVNCGPPSDNGQSCQFIDRDTGRSGCPQGRTCVSLINPVGHLLCRCLSV